MDRLLLIEDDPKDMRIAAEAVNSIGFSSVEARASLDSAKTYLEKGLMGEIPLPEVIVLDLNLGHDNGHELLRIWHANSRLSEIPLIVWSILGEDQRDMCRLFKVSAYVGKWEGAAALCDALRRLERPEQ